MRAAAKLLRPRHFARAASTATGPKKVAVLAGDGIGEEVRCATRLRARRVVV